MDTDITNDLIHLVVYPQGAARCVVSLEELPKMLSADQVVFLNGQLAERMIGDLQKRLAKELAEEIA